MIKNVIRTLLPSILVAALSLAVMAAPLAQAAGFCGVQG